VLKLFSSSLARKQRKHQQISMAPEPEDDVKDEKNPRPLDEDDIALLKTYVCFFFLNSKP
jgi:hypothetical protein